MVRLGRLRPFRLLIAASIVAAGVLAAAAPASAHALAVSSTPPAGATLAQAPKTVTVVFSEPPDPRLSSIQILDSAGNPHQTGHSSAIPGEPTALEVGVGALSPGVYTVNWRTVSRVDGHLATGSFAFGVKVTPTGAAATAGVVRSPPASTWAVAARWSYYIGLMGLVGVAEIGLLTGAAGAPRRLRGLATASLILGVLGVVALEEQQRRADGISVSGLWSSSLGHEVFGRAAPLVVAAAAIAWMWARPRRVARITLGVVGAAALVSMFGDVDASHAAGEHSWRWFRLLTQWVHFASAGVWLGGLAVLVAVVLHLPPERRPLVTRRFSNLALVAVAAVAATGLLRGLDEIRSWHGLFDTSFGRWALLKIALLVVLIGLGVLQRRRGVPAVGGTGRGSVQFLRRVGATELALGLVVLVAAGFLQSLAPPSATTPARAPRPLVVSGHDFATTVEVRLEISPGTPGFNRFDLRALDYDTQQPVVAQSVTLAFDLPSRPDLGSSTLTLSRQRNGDYAAVAPNLSVAGAWTLTALIQRSSESAEVTLPVTTRSAPVRIDVSRSPGVPTVYTIHVTPTASIQVYLDPGRPGFNEFHVTVLGANGNELPTSSVVVHAARAGSAVASSLTVRRLDNIGHYVADLPAATSGNYQFSIDATTDQGSLHADITIPVS